MIKPDMLIKLLEQNTPSGREEETRTYVLTELKRLGFTAKVDKAGNVYAVRGKAEKYPMLNAHMDIVDDWGFGYSRATSRWNMRRGYGYDCSTAYLHEGGSYSWVADELQAQEKAKGAKVSEAEELAVLEAQFLLMSHIQDAFVELTNKASGADFSCTMEEQAVAKQVVEALDRVSNKVYHRDTMDGLKGLADLFIGYLEDAELHEELSSFITEWEELLAVEEPKEKGFKVTYNTKTYEITGSGGRVLGGDDKCGIFIALTALEKLKDLPAKVLFTVEEEIGCLGVDAFVRTKAGQRFLKDVGYSLTIDRKGGADLLYKQTGSRSCTWEFAGKLAYHGIKEGVPVKLENGSVADVITIRDFVPNSVNMSAGYYSPHSEDEYVKFDEVVKIIKWVQNILQDKDLLTLKGYRPYTSKLLTGGKEYVKGNVIKIK